MSAVRKAYGQPTVVSLQAHLNLTQAELRIVREQREILRRVVRLVHGLAKVEATGGSATWSNAAEQIATALRLTA